MDLGGLVNGLFGAIGSALTGLFNIVVQAALALITWLLGLIPSLPLWPGGDAGAAVNTVLLYATTGLNAWNYYVCIKLIIVLAVLVILPAEILSAVWKGLRWLITHIPWVGGAEGSGE